MVQRNGITKFDKCKSAEMITINVKTGRQFTVSTWVCAGFLGRELKVRVEVLLESSVSVYRVAVAMVTAVQDLDTATRCLTETERTPSLSLPHL